VATEVETSIWGRPYAHDLGLLPREAWSMATKRVVEDLRSGRATLDEAFAFALGALEGVDRGSGEAKSSGTATTFPLRTVTGEQVGTAALHRRALGKPASISLVIPCAVPTDLAPFADAGGTLVVITVTPSVQEFVDELERTGERIDLAPEIASVSCTTSIEMDGSGVRSLREGDELSMGGWIWWRIDAQLGCGRTLARAVTQAPADLRFEQIDALCTIPRPGILAEDGLWRIQRLLERQ
jgi:hypothetical protein